MLEVALLFAAEGGEPVAGAGLSTLIMMLGLFAVIYFLMIRPQRRRQQSVQQMQRALSVGDDVITIGGIYGQVKSMSDDTVDLFVDTEGTIMRFRRSAIAEVLRDDVDEDEDDIADVIDSDDVDSLGDKAE